MRIWLDRKAMAARGLTVADVEAALRRENVELPAGRLESATRDFTLRIERGYASVAQFRRMALIKGDDGYVVRLGDVAKVEVDAEDRRAWYRGNGEPQVGLGIIKTSTANSLEVARTVAAEARRISPTLPEGMHLVVAYDATVFTDDADRTSVGEGKSVSVRVDRGVRRNSKKKKNK